MLQGMNQRTALFPGRMCRYYVVNMLLIVLCACTTKEQATTQQLSLAPTAILAPAATLCAATPPVVDTAPLTVSESAQSNVAYDAEKRIITLSAGSDLTLPQLSTIINDEQVLNDLGPGEWLLGASIRIKEGGKLHIGGSAVSRLRLRSDGDGFVSIKALGGTLEIIGTCITSWDSARRDVDTNYEDGRSFILARDGGRMTIRDSELSYLGYGQDESYGVAWRLKGTKGEIVNSTLGYNYYGLYLYQASDIVITGNEVHHSILYGIDPHTKSNRLRIERNRSHHNGKHGIILANGCNDSIILNNEVYANGIHGIVLYQGSNTNIVKDNTVYDNKQEGIDLNGSSDNTIHSNTTYGNTDAGIGIGQGSRNNHIQNNTVHANHTDGISLYSNAYGNQLDSNSVYRNNRYGMYIKSAHNIIGSKNKVYENQVGVYVNANPAPEISLKKNQIYNNSDANVRSGD